MSREYLDGDISFDNSGMDEFETMLNNCIDRTKDENVLNAIEKGTQEFVNDLLKLPKPRRKLKASGYTHLVQSFAYKRMKNNIEVGWGKYYGPMVEHGTMYMNAQPHLEPTFRNNEEKYYRTMQKALFG